MCNDIAVHIKRVDRFTLRVYKGGNQLDSDVSE